MYMVHKVVSTGANNGMLDWGGTAAGNNAWPFGGGTIYTDFGSSAQYNIGNPTTSLSAAYHITSVEAAANSYAFYVDGGTGGSAGGTSPLYSNNYNTVAWTSAPPFLGATTVAGRVLDGWVAEIYFTNAVQTTADRQKNEGYLAWKWGLQGNLDPSHPYKSAAPLNPLPLTMSIGGGVTGGTPGSVLFIDNIGALAQDNNSFFWNDTTKTLKLGAPSGGYLYNLVDTINSPTNFERGILDWNVTANVFTIGTPASSHGGTGQKRETRLYTMDKPALFIVPSASGDNWFEDNAGNFTMTGYQNFGTGDGALSSLTTGFQNAAFGTSALANCTIGSSNMAVGFNTLLNCTTGIDNVAIGSQALTRCTTSNSNIALGTSALLNLQTGSQNVAIGEAAGSGSLTTASYNTAIGGGTLNVAKDNSTGNTLIGCYAGSGLTSVGGDSYNTFIGFGAGQNMPAADSCTIMGMWNGPSAYRSSIVAFANRNDQLLQDWSYITNNVWSFQASVRAAPVGLHVYNILDNYNSPVNYERAILDWNATANIFSIGTQAGGTGVVRPMKFVGLPNKTTPIGADHIILSDSASSGTLATALISSLPGGGGGMSIGGAVTGGTPGSVLFIDGSSNLTQDNANFFWDDISKYLKIGSSGTQAVVYLNSLPALYQKPNASGANWFEGNAGNVTLTGYSNFGTGDNCLSSLTSGYQNTAVGTFALQDMKDGSNNVALGSSALRFCVSDQNNMAMGASALGSLGSGGAGAGSNGNNVAIGVNAMVAVYQANNNVAMGPSSMANIGSGSVATFNTAIGSGSGENLGVGGGSPISNNVLIGANAGQNITGSSSNNTWIGGFKGPSAVVNNTVCISDGLANTVMLDYSITSSNTWTFPAVYGSYPTPIHIYNSQSGSLGTVPANYERAVLDWATTANVFSIGTQAGGTGVKRIIAIDGFQKAGAPAAGDLPSGSFALINDTSGGQTWLAYNAAGTIRKVQLV
jgi:hypothetical protein